MSSQPPFSLKRFLGTRPGLVALVSLTLAAIFLIAKHATHLYGILPFALLLLCPLLHLFLHRGHGRHHGHDSSHGHGTQEQHSFLDLEK